MLAITCPMASSQIVTSKNPNIGAINLKPRENMIYRMVPMETSHIQARNMSTGINPNVKRSDERNPTSIGSIE